MKAKTSRGIVMKLICCAALIVIASAVAFSQTPKSGALLAITSDDNSVNLKIYDSQIHTGNIRTNSCDQIPTDAYVLQGGAPTGCDSGDAFETANGNGVTGTATLGNFSLTAQYLCASTNCGALANSATCNSNANICIDGNTPGASIDSGFLTVKNNGSPFVGTITLTGTSPLTSTDSAFCPVGGNASDSITFIAGSPFGTNDTRIFALSTDSSNCGGFNAPQILPLTAGQPSTAKFGKDDYQIMPLNSATGDTLSVLPVPVPAGPLGLDGWGTGKFGSETPVFSPLRFSAGTNFAPTTYACVPYADFSANVANGNPVCVELQIECTNTITASACSDAFLYTVQNDFNIDGNSLLGGIGGPAFLGHHLVPCPDTAFDLNIFTSYTAPSATFGDPLKGGGSGTPSCWVTAFDPNATAVTTGNTVSSFTGFTGLLAPNAFNPVHPGSAQPLNFTYKNSSGSPVTNLHLCTTVVNNGTSCLGGAARPWVAFGTIPIDCSTFVVSPTSQEISLAAGGSNLQNFGGGSYRFNWKTLKTAPLNTCVVVVTQFDTGLVVFPDDFKYVK
jgi:hypothetical protein